MDLADLIKSNIFLRHSRRSTMALMAEKRFDATTELLAQRAGLKVSQTCEYQCCRTDI
jgi:hypothetical protein